ncbi:MAG: glycosyltransferase family 39 protein [Planctomycetota bacterium]|nr:glycosyltransferase family 39 protein [Planctomycetota bacterium]MDA1211276.1 glycosyltransferase family 39 protein [Planctomycetota bacterium]
MPTGLEQRRHVYAASAIVLGALFIRWRASLGEFWLDEIWSWFLVQFQVTSWSDVVFTLKHDNNHLLNSWFLYALGPGQDWTIYRLPSVLFGTATVALAGWWGRLHGTSVGWFAMILTAGSYVLTHYSSEARGYAPLMFFSLLAFIAMERALATGKAKWDVVWNFAAIFGVLSHATFVTMLVSIGLWSVVTMLTSATSKGYVVLRLLRWHFIPVLFAGWLYWVNLSQVAIGGGIQQSPLGVVRDALSLTIGGPFENWVSTVFAGIVATSVIVCLTWLAVTRQKRYAFAFAMIIAIAPVGLVAFLGYSDLYVRFFLTSILFVMLLFSLALGRLYDAGGRRRWFAVAITIAIVAGNAVHIERVFRLGRGSYLVALDLILNESRDDRTVIAFDNDFRHRLVVAFYQNRIVKLQSMDFVEPQRAWSNPEWLLTHGFDRDWQPVDSITPTGGTRYDLVRVFPYAGLSGWSLGVYRRAED